MIRIRFGYQTGQTLGFSIERLGDSGQYTGWFYDFSATAFSASPAQQISPLPEGTGNLAGSYNLNFGPTPQSLFTDGDYVVRVHNALQTPSPTIGVLAAYLKGGDDATPLTTGGGPGSDPLAAVVPGQYAQGTAGYALGNGVPILMNQSVPYRDLTGVIPASILVSDALASAWAQAYAPLIESGQSFLISGPNGTNLRAWALSLDSQGNPTGRS